MSLPQKPKIAMALSREYRIRELYLKFFEENFSRERTREFVSILNQSEIRLLKRLSRLSNPEDETRNKAIFNAYLYSLFEFYARHRQRISSLKELKRFLQHYPYQETGDYLTNLPAITQALAHCKLWELQTEDEANQLAASVALFQEFLNSLPSVLLADFSDSLKKFVTQKVSALLDEEPFGERVRLYGQLIQTPTRDAASRLEAVRTALQCMPIGNQKSSNIFLYIILKVYGLWPEASTSLLHVPADTDLSRVMFRIGITQKKLGNLEYGTIGYSAMQTIARRLNPKNPSALYGLKRVSKLWCKSRSTACDQCPMNSICSYAQSILV
jgi:hypothetical protein